MSFLDIFKFSGIGNQSDMQKKLDAANRDAAKKQQCTEFRITPEQWEERRQQQQNALQTRNRRSVANKMQAAARIQTAPINPERPYVAPKWENRPSVNVELSASDGTKVVVDKTRFQRLFGL